ncbi:DNA-binding protein [Kitasatospora purpeofusca]|uniref:DNA-binding protein n=1 Tax=Kitasatospora purpeofusca TaxID=67352 RepID=UPI002258B2E5|nr:DNA-binding protein [Kitasatospora purpeofusca]MCX4755094.1 DNA-binding protein [Kitasatospora purpeofusca]WSR29491.1 DNA-binding protein [Kitasatospora purpeofusca]WSR37008.1 DNA-binding protein [Kitasatospora purpeofusca]
MKKLMATGVVPGVRETGRQVFPLAALQQLQARPAADLTVLGTAEVAVLRSDAPQRVEEPDREWIGFGTDMDAAQLLAALSGWWRCDPARVAAGGVLPVTVAGFVVAVLTGLTEWEADGTVGTAGRYRFPKARLAGYLTDLTAPANAADPADTEDARLAGLLLGTRLASVSGGPIAYATTNPTTDTADEGGVTR